MYFLTEHNVCFQTRSSDTKQKINKKQTKVVFRSHVTKLDLTGHRHH